MRGQHLFHVGLETGREIIGSLVPLGANHDGVRLDETVAVVSPHDAALVDRGVVERLMASPYFTRTGAKSLDRYDFPLDAVAGLSDADAAATLTAFTVAAVVACRAQLGEAAAHYAIVALPSSSPLHTVGVAAKQKAWLALADYL